MLTYFTYNPLANAGGAKKLLTFPAISRNIKSLTTISGLSQPLFMRFFCAYLMAQSRLFYGELIGLNTIPTGNKSSRLIAVSEACHLCLSEVVKSKSKTIRRANHA